MFNSSLPLELARTLPADEYWRVNHNVFESTWQYVCPTSKLDKIGDYVTSDLDGNPLVFVRNEDGIMGYHNVCRHHASVLLEGEGHCSKIRCPYHGWTYELNGELKGVPEFDGVMNFKREDNGLKPINTTTFGPLLFGALETPRFPIPIEMTVPWYLFHSRREYDLRCNWKVFVDNYLDGGYHVNSVHPDLASSIDYKKYYSIIHGHAVEQVAPLKSTDNVIGLIRSGDVAHYWWVFPNLMLNFYNNMMDVNLVVPTGKTTCRVIVDFFYDDKVFCSQVGLSKVQASINMSEQIQQEDILICERVQKGLKSSSYDSGRYSVTREGGMYLFHKLLADY